MRDEFESKFFEYTAYFVFRDLDTSFHIYECIVDIDRDMVHSRLIEVARSAEYIHGFPEILHVLYDSREGRSREEWVEGFLISRARIGTDTMTLSCEAHRSRIEAGRFPYDTRSRITHSRVHTTYNSGDRYWSVLVSDYHISLCESIFYIAQCEDFFSLFCHAY